MQNVHVDTKPVQDEFKQLLELMTEAGRDRSRDIPDRITDRFGDLLSSIARNPIESPEHMQMLRQSIDYLMKEGPEVFRGSLEDAMDAALAQAMSYERAASPLQTALLALARYRLQCMNFGGLNA